jgi:prefoldin subunit 5
MDDKQIIAELKERIEELETANSTLNIAVDHWRETYRHLEQLYSQLAGRG